MWIASESSSGYMKVMKWLNEETSITGLSVQLGGYQGGQLQTRSATCPQGRTRSRSDARTERTVDQPGALPEIQRLVGEGSSGPGAGVRRIRRVAE